MVGRVLIGMVRVYQLVLSPLLPPVCRFYPTCSEYMAQAIHRHGPWQGIWLGLWRLLKCHPWHPGGVDLVPESLDASDSRITAAHPSPHPSN